MRKLDDIIPPSRRQAMDAPMQPAAPDPTPPAKSPQPFAPGEPPRYIAGSKKRFPWFAIIAAVVIVGGSAGALVYYSGAEIQVTPAETTVAVSGSFTAGSASTADMSYTIVSAQKVAIASVPMTGTKQVSTAAMGTLTVYNTQPHSQKLIPNTRFAAGSGAVFRIHNAITIPAGSPNKPGSVNTTVYADQPGSQYNIGPSSFTVPGLAGSPQFAEITAKSAGAMSGGASGTVPVVDPSAESSTRGTLATALAAELQSTIASQVPAGYALLAGAATTTYQALPSTAGSSSGTATLSEQGTITAIVFPSIALAHAIQASLGTTSQAVPATVANPGDLTLSSSRPLPTDSSASYTFTLAGSAQLVANIDPSQLAAAIAGKSRSDASVTLKSFPQIQQALLILRPFWRSSFPQDPASIKVVVNPPSAN